MTKILLAIFLIFSLYSCQSDDKANDPNSTNTLESLLAPDSNSNAQQNTATSTNIHDIWVLDSINNNPIVPDQFAHGTPYLELDTAGKTAKGHTGCNSFDGPVKIEGNKMTFEKLNVSKEVCNDKGFEKNFIKGLKSGNVTHLILNYKLYLKTGPASVYIFRRIRR